MHSNIFTIKIIRDYCECCICLRDLIILGPDQGAIATTYPN